MGEGFIIGCNNCIKEEDIKNLWNEKFKINGTYFDIHLGGLMLCFCKEQLEKRYGVYKNYNREYRLLAAGDPPEEIYETLGSATNDPEIDNIIIQNINNGYEFTEELGDYAYYCKGCKKLFNRFYFQMKKDKQIYTPEYICKKCNNFLELVNVKLNEYDGIGLEDDETENEPIEIKYKYELYLENGIVKLKNNEGNKDIICDYCKQDNFSILSSYMAD